MKNPRVISKKYYRRTVLMLPVACLLAFTGCSNIQGTSGNQAATTHRVATYLEQSQEQPDNQPVDQDPGYEWFY
jgi:hypothetical protein